MTYTRASILGSVGLALLLALACSASKQEAPTAGSGARDERVAEADDTCGAPKPPEEQLRPADCDYDPVKGFNVENLKWRNTLARPRELAPTTKDGREYEVKVCEKEVQILPDCYPKTKVFAYGGLTVGPGEEEPTLSFSTPGPTFEMKRGKGVQVKWINGISGEHLLPIDPTLHWANPEKYELPAGPLVPDSKWQSPVPIVTHVHGLEVAPSSDGSPRAWFINGESQLTEYPNSQLPTTLWYHDHALGITRLNVYAGLAGMYIIRDDDDAAATKLPDRAHEMPLVIQDRSFKQDGSLSYPDNGTEHHPYWVGNFFGDAMVVNGKLWPKMEVERTRYRFRVLNGANSQTFTFSLAGPSGSLPFTVIGSDGGYLAAPANTESLRLAPGERADVVVDFSTIQPNESVMLSSDGTDVVKFEVPQSAAAPEAPSCHLVPPIADSSSAQQLAALPSCFPEGLPKSKNDLSVEGKVGSKRTVTLVGGGDHALLLNGQMFHAAVTERPKLGTTEDWDIVNTTFEDHPIHLHLVQFKLLSRQELTEKYLVDWQAQNGTELPLDQPPINPEISDDYVTGAPLATAVAESGWKDTILAPGNSVTRIRVRWTPQEETEFPFVATGAPGYVWHCHMLEHEDNDMMRPLEIDP